MSSFDDILLSPGVYEELFRKWEADPSSVEPSWRKVFQELERRPELAPPERMGDDEGLRCRVSELIEAWRARGHLQAAVNPLEKAPKADERLEWMGDLSQVCPTLGVLREAEAPIGATLKRLRHVYGDKIGFEFKGCTTPEIEAWFQEQLEQGDFPPSLPIEEKQMILEELSKSELLERFMHTKYVGQKRFSLEGSETLIPMIREVIETAPADEFVIGMAHRGRLNVLSNILNKSYKEIFSEFVEGYIPDKFEGSGDVKYHKGFEVETKTKKGRAVKIILTPNPSHLESVDSVVVGQVKGKQVQGKRALAILIHGDAALAGQGVVYETLQMQNLPGYSVGGTIHLVINNQIGFTTHPSEGRSTHYCTDIAKAFGCPVIHVNSEDPEGCVAAVSLACAFRERFSRDIFIDLVCWRKYGHNESDEPVFTQPLLYQRIREKTGVRELYRDHLIHGGTLEHVLAESMEEEFKKALLEAKESLNIPEIELKGNGEKASPYRPPTVTTSVPLNTLQEIAKKIATWPETLSLHPKVAALAKERESMTLDRPVDWGMGEWLAYGTLLAEGRPVRLSGQDVERGTFSHRHAVWIDQKTGEKYCPFTQLHIYNSILSEFAALGFEFGYSLSTPNGLTIWEAQFGDFANGAQVIMDQYLASSEQKWGQKSNITLFLPHGYEGQGPEHSSARIERFLSLAGHDNMRICYPSLPHQLFHLLRRQALGKEAKPLIIFTPKALLRAPACTSSIHDFTQGVFQEVIDDPNAPKNPLKLVFCTGKVYFELVAHAQKIKEEAIAFVRIEQLYPLHTERLLEILARYSGVKAIYWIQEEPRNMGAGPYIHPRLEALAGRNVNFIARDEAASPAAGIYLFHKKERRDVIEKVFAKEQPTTYEIAGQMRA